MIARFGGDEFGVLLSEATEESALLAFGQRVCDVLHAPFSTPDTVVNIAGCVGFALFPEAVTTSEQLY